MVVLPNGAGAIAVIFYKMQKKTMALWDRKSIGGQVSNK